MKKFKTFKHVFHKSLTSINYYKDVVKAPLSFSIKYLGMLAIVAAFITTLGTSLVFIPETIKFSKEVLANISTVYPNDLVFKMENGEWSVNRPEPFFIPLPEFAREKSMPVNIAVFYKAGTVEDIEKLDTMVLINKVNILVRGNHKLEVYPIKDYYKGAPNGQFTKDNYIVFTATLRRVAPFIPYVIVVTIALASLVYFFGVKLVYLLVVSAFLWVINKAVKANLNFGKLYKISIHTLTLPLILEVIIWILPINTSVDISWLFFLQLLIGAIVIARISAK